MSDDTVFFLTPGERQSALWRKLRAHLEEKLEHTRGKNDGPNDPIVTAALRGQISTLKALIAHDTDAPVVP